MRPDVKDAYLREGGSEREVFLRAPADWDTQGAQRITILRAPASGLDGAPAAWRKTLNGYLLQNRDFLTLVGHKFGASSFGPRLYFSVSC